MAAPELDLDPGAGPFGVAVSGGADSLALLLACHAAGLAARAATVDHGLRPESADEAGFVAALCAARGIPHDTLRLDLADGPALQARAREARYAALADWAGAHGLRAVLLGHTADDVAEGFVMRLADGAGLDGLAAMEPRIERCGAVFLRPILGASRAGTLAHVRSEGVEPVEDPTNTDPRFERARVRRLLSQLGIDTAQVAASAAALRAVRRSVDARTRALVARAVRLDRGDWLIARDDWEALLRDDPEQARRVLLSGLRAIGGRPHPPRRAEQEELMRRVAAARTATLAGCLLTFVAGALRLAREPAAAAAAPDADPGAIWDGRWRVLAPPGAPPGARVRALGAAISELDWRDAGLPRRSAMAGPSVWQGGTLLAAPLLGHGAGWRAELVTAPAGARGPGH